MPDLMPNEANPPMPTPPVPGHFPPIHHLMTQYPSREQIELALPLFEPSDALKIALDGWRRAGRGTALTLERLQQLPAILWPATQASERAAPTVTVSVVTGNPSYCFVPALNTINLGSKPSIISTLHELGHAIYGQSELSACAFSVGLFKAVYPRSFAKLEWRGHMLIKPHSTSSPITSMEGESST